MRDIPTPRYLIYRRKITPNLGSIKLKPGGQRKPKSNESVHRFGPFELNTSTRELKKHGLHIKLPEQPCRILMALLEEPGNLISREQLRERIWPGDSAGDFEQGLNRAVSKLRSALNDRAGRPLYIETLTGRGYRFIGTLENASEEEEEALPTPTRRLIPLVMILLAVAATITLAKVLTPPSIPALRWRKLTTDVYTKTPPVLSDGRRIYFSARFEGEQFIAEVPLSGGQPTRVPITPPGTVFSLQDLSPDGQDLLLTAAATSDRVRFMPLWTLRLGDGSARRLGSIVAINAAYSPSGQIIAFTTPGDLWLASNDGTHPRRLVETQEDITDSISWTPDGNWIRFTRRDPLSNFATPWEIRSDGSGLRKLLPPSVQTSLVSAGSAIDGRFGIFFGGGAFWAKSESWSGRTGATIRLAEDAPEFDGSVRIGGANTFYAVGTDRLGELQAYNIATGVWRSILDGISADTVEYSPDGEKVAYVTYPQRTLWVRQTNGKRPIQLTSPPLEAAFPQWSSDSGRIAFSAAESADKPIRLYVVDADGGPVKLAIPSAKGSQGYPSWSPDGKTLLYGIASSSLREEVYIRSANLVTGEVTKLEGSEGLYAPRWSPDGRMIAALRFSGERTLMVMKRDDHRWKETAGLRVEWPTWTPDSRSILCRSGDQVLRYRIETDKFQTITAMKPEEIGGYSRWIGIGPGDVPLRTLNRDSGQIYALQLNPR